MKKTARDFSRGQVKKLAEEYANTPIPYSAEYFSKEYGISTSTFYNLMEKAVYENIVSDETVNLMEAKAMSNSQLNAGIPGAIRSKKHYEHLKMKRKIYVPSKKLAKEIVNRFALSSSTLTDFANKNYMNVDYLRRIIRTCVVENYIADDVFNILEEKFSTNHVNKNFWSSVKAEREKKKRG